MGELAIALARHTECGADMRHIESLADVSAPYNAILSDIWGVLHNGVRHLEVDSRYANNCPLWQVMDHDKARATVDDDIVDQFRGQWG